MPWRETYKLEWTDFKGKPDANNDAVAMTASGISFNYSIKKTTSEIISFETEVKALFYPEHSWCKKGEVDAHVLAHEQLHFDITELHARLFREKISHLKASSELPNILQKYNRQINQDLKVLQRAYDNETDFSIDKEAQAQWQIKISNALEKVQKFR